MRHDVQHRGNGCERVATVVRNLDGIAMSGEMGNAGAMRMNRADSALLPRCSVGNRFIGSAEPTAYVGTYIGSTHHRSSVHSAVVAPLILNRALSKLAVSCKVQTAWKLGRRRRWWQRRRGGRKLGRRRRWWRRRSGGRKLGRRRRWWRQRRGGAGVCKPEKPEHRHSQGSEADGELDDASISPRSIQPWLASRRTACRGGRDDRHAT
eukprot:scaffold23839_cov100-Isochrysis_galbana.AAC.4